MSWVPYETSIDHQKVVARLALEQQDPSLIEEYFTSLENEIKERPLIDGKVVVGVGTGRCGSLSLTKIVGSIASACVTHENPIWYGPVVDFHIRRFKILRKRFAVVFNISPITLKYVSRLSDVKIISLRRDIDDTLVSFKKTVGLVLSKRDMKGFYERVENLHGDVLVVDTITLNHPETQQKIFDFIGEPGVYRPVHANKAGALEQRPWF